MSSPTKRRAQRSSASVTPRRSARAPVTSSPPPVGPEEQLQAEASQASQVLQYGSQATPRNTRSQTASTLSPLLFRSSPVESTGPGAVAGDDESDGGATPKASAMTIGGMQREVGSMSRSHH